MIMPRQEHKGLLESINVRLEKDQGDNLKKVIDATKAILAAVGSSISTNAEK